MKKYKQTMLLCGAILTTSIALANNKPGSLDISGSVKLNQQQFKSINISGNLDTEGISVSGKTDVSGAANFVNSQLHVLDISGTTSLVTSQVVGKVDISGDMVVSQSNITGDKLDCSGKLKSYKSTYSSPIDLSGNLDSRQDTFNGTITISGKIDADSSVFNKNITMSADKSSWKNSTINANVTNNTRVYWGTPTITLENTQVHGGITFTKTKGLIILKGNSKIGGVVENAEVKQD